MQIFAYELRLACTDAAERAEDGSSSEDRGAITSEELEGLYGHLEQTLEDIGYHDPDRPKLLMRRLRRLFGRARPDRAELNILRGILAATQRAAGKSRG